KSTADNPSSLYWPLPVSRSAFVLRIQNGFLPLFCKETLIATRTEFWLGTSVETTLSMEPDAEECGRCAMATMIATTTTAATPMAIIFAGGRFLAAVPNSSSMCGSGCASRGVGCEGEGVAGDCTGGGVGGWTSSGIIVPGANCSPNAQPHVNLAMRQAQCASCKITMSEKS